jgi:starvation-inducible DNA-binding protein
MALPRIGHVDEDFSWNKETDAVRDISATLNALVADFFTLHLKTRNFHWHVSGPHFREYHLMFGEQADQIFEALDLVAERVRKIGGSTLRSVDHVCRLARLRGNDADLVSPSDMLKELGRDNRKLAEFLRDAHLICSDYVDIASASALEPLIDQAERRAWFLSECLRSI